MADFWLILKKNHRFTSNYTIESDWISSEIYDNSCFYHIWDFGLNMLKKHFALESNLPILKKTHLRIECLQVICLTYWWKMCVFWKFIKKTPNIDFVFWTSKTPLHVTFSRFLPLIFFKTSKVQHTHVSFPHFSNPLSPLIHLFWTFYMTKFLILCWAKKKNFFF